MFGRYFEKILKEKTINLLKSEIIDYKKQMIEYELRKNELEFERHRNKYFNNERLKKIEEDNINFLYERYLEFYYKKRAVEKILCDYLSLFKK